MNLRLARKIAAAGGAFRWSTVDASKRRLNKAVNTHWARLARVWTTPTMREDFVCANCDGAPDGGHTGDIACMHYEMGVQ